MFIYLIIHVIINPCKRWDSFGTITRYFCNFIFKLIIIIINLKIKFNKKEKEYCDLDVKVKKLNTQLEQAGIKKEDALILNYENSDSKQTKKSLDKKTLSNDINLEKRDIFNEIENTNSNFFITGKAGTGKSFLLKYIRDNTNKNVLCAAPTGISALNIGAVTLHSAFGYGNLINNNPIYLSSNQKEFFKVIDTIIIDEISMVSAHVFHQIDKILRIANDNNELFGGKQIILFGDLFQLPPVANKAETQFLNDQYGGVFFFNYSGYEEGAFNFKELHQVFRQNDIKFLSALNNIREGIILKDNLDLLNERFINNIPAFVTQIVPRKDTANVINSNKLNSIISKLYVYKAEVFLSDFDIRQSDFSCDLELNLKVGSLIMMISNDREAKRWVNGSLGIITQLRTNEIIVMIDSIKYEISRTTFTKYKSEYNKETKKIEYVPVIEISQFPLILAYAITIHKSQGMTYQRIAVDIEDTFAPGQAYVALSRCANFEELYLTHKIRPENIMVNNSVINFYNNIRYQNKS